MLCGAVGAGEICAGCEASLDRVGSACPVCASPMQASHRCGACLRRAPAFEGAVAVFSYRFPLERLVQRFKYSGDLAIGRWLALQLAARVADEECPDVIVSPPLTRARLRARGFNHALEIAKVVSRRVGARCELRAISRVSESVPQAGLSRRARLANLRGAFRCDADLRGLDLAVVDDVITTGATAEAMARTLKAAGAARVRIWAVARTPEPGR